MKTVNLTENEVRIFNLLVTKGTNSKGTNINTEIEESNNFLLDEVYSTAKTELGKSKLSVRGTLANLEKKGLVKCYKGESCFDGELTDDGIEYWSQLNTAKVSNQQVTEMNNMENSKENSVMDERIVRMNAILSTKLSAVSKGKREGIKAQKSTARFLIDNWDDANALKRVTDDEEVKVTQYELWCIAKSRFDQIMAKLAQEQDEYARAHMDFKRIEMFKDDLKSLSITENKVWAILHGYYDDDKVMTEELSEDEILKDAFEYRKKMLTKVVEPKKSVRTTVQKKSAASKAGKQPMKHAVGDLHPNGKWIWTEYKPGKFDWRGIPKDGSNKKTNVAKKSSTTKTTAVKKTEPKKKPTFKEFQERCEKGAGQGLTKTQKDAKKYLLRGYKIEHTQGNSCFLKKDGEITKSSFIDSIEGLFRKVGMTGIPSELFVK